jgi:hypothetical protein
VRSNFEIYDFIVNQHKKFHFLSGTHYEEGVMVFNATFNNISVISWRSVLLVEETGELGKNHRPVASHRQTLSHNVVPSALGVNMIRTHNFNGYRH